MRMPARLVDHGAQRLRHRRPGVEEIHIDAARPVVAGRHGRRRCGRPRRAQPTPHASIWRMQSGPSSHSRRARLSSHRPRPASSVSCRWWVQWSGVSDAERDRDRHLRHHGGAAAADQAAVGEQHLRAGARRLDRRIHAGAARSDHEHVGLDMHGAGHDITPSSIASLPVFGEGGRAPAAVGWGAPSKRRAPSTLTRRPALPEDGEGEGHAGRGLPSVSGRNGAAARLSR